jgi:hypothetical protein
MNKFLVYLFVFVLAGNMLSVRPVRPAHAQRVPAFIDTTNVSVAQGLRRVEQGRHFWVRGYGS